MTTLPLSPGGMGRRRQAGVDRRVLGAGNETRTRDPNLGKVVLYQLSYSRRNSRTILTTDEVLSSGMAHGDVEAEAVQPSSRGAITGHATRR